MNRPLILASLPLLVFTLACAGSSPTVPPLDESVPPKPIAEQPSRCGDRFELVDHWPGEYPTPVVAVMQPVNVPGRVKPCDVEATLTCTLPERLIHPWAGPPLIPFATVVEQRDYRATKALEQKDVEEKVTWALSPGDLVRVTAYYSEGVCALKWGDKTMDGYCPSDDDFVAVNPAADGSNDVQLFAVDCSGTLGWVEVDEALFARNEIQKGAVTGYGTIGPPGDPNTFIE